MLLRAVVVILNKYFLLGLCTQNLKVNETFYEFNQHYTQVCIRLNIFSFKLVALNACHRKRCNGTIYLRFIVQYSFVSVVLQQLNLRARSKGAGLLSVLI